MHGIKSFSVDSVGNSIELGYKIWKGHQSQLNNENFVEYPIN